MCNLWETTVHKNHKRVTSFHSTVSCLISLNTLKWKETRETHFKLIYKVVIIYEELYLSYPQGLSWLLTFTSHFFKRYLLLLLIWWYFICKQNYLFKSHLHSRLCSTGVFKIHLESLILLLDHEYSNLQIIVNLEMCLHSRFRYPYTSHY